MKYLNDISYKDCVGKICKSLNSGDFEIIKYNNIVLMNLIKNYHYFRRKYEQGIIRDYL